MEIKEALFDINEDSAQGPDGFSSGFFKSTWEVVGEDFCQAIMEFFAHGCLLKQVNATLIILIPKVQLPTKVGDFRPISYCNVIYKVITKIMVKQMHLVLDKLIDNSQNTFVPGRSILDNVLLAQELLSGYNQKRLPPRCTIKGDPMLPYLFILVMESLHLLLKSKADLYSVNVLHGALQEFKVASGLQANAQKSQILLSKAAEYYQEQIIQLLGFTRGSLPIRGFGNGRYKVAWEQICKPITHGGLGVRNTQTMNQALMAKHLWQILTMNPDSI
ncbi:UNVERIFIED_CONTAM: hypothetical protein Slati_2688300 [Sesamum latifolium]|uniref:Reverse transcriptase domain-containing protein n=1 Tax=Sesamum latifolium TaxID=2727402 RepID=A0AAW2VVN2_9LAMI